MHRTLWSPILLAVLAASMLHAQTGNASISGQVRDSSGAVIPGATVSVKNRDTNVTRTTITNADGRYLILNLIPGTYTLASEFQGFKRLEREGILLRVGDRIGLDLSMELGGQQRASRSPLRCPCSAPRTRSQAW